MDKDQYRIIDHGLCALDALCCLLESMSDPEVPSPPFRLAKLIRSATTPMGEVLDELSNEVHKEAQSDG
jgi:hypothetical protein